MTDQYRLVFEKPEGEGDVTYKATYNGKNSSQENIRIEMIDILEDLKIDKYIKTLNNSAFNKLEIVVNLSHLGRN